MTFVFLFTNAFPFFQDIDFKQFPCKRQKTGDCELEEDCMYSHDLTTDNSATKSEETSHEKEDTDTGNDNNRKEQKMDTPV